VVREQEGIALGHTRLAILDLSERGAQPMTSASGRYVVTFNGEIYNFPFLRRELEVLGAQFSGTSDTEVILAGCEYWGIEDTITRLEGMFALGVWDEERKLLHLARDKHGIKPLYYGFIRAQGIGEFLFFGSELRLVQALGDEIPPQSKAAFELFMKLGYVPYPYSIYEGVFKLPPGCSITVNQNDVRRGLTGLSPWVTGPADLVRPVAYFSHEDRFSACLLSRDSSAPGNVVDELEGVLGNAVERHMLSDVPLGSFLSGGIDSTLITALMQRRSSKPIRSFTIGFHEAGFDEAKDARRIAFHLGTDHHELYVSPPDVIGVIPEIPSIYDEPFADSSQIPTLLVSRFASSSVKVVLSGDGGDEVFGGYNRHLWTPRLTSILSIFPHLLRRVAASSLRKVPEGFWNSLSRIVGRVIPVGSLPAVLPEKITKMLSLIDAKDLLDLYDRMISVWQNSAEALTEGGSVGRQFLARFQRTAQASVAEQIMFWDLRTYLVGDILTKVDRASMHYGLEARVPYLDQSVVDFSWQLPLNHKVNRGTTKAILRELLYRYVPASLFERPKMGFGIPLESWLKGPLRGWAEDLLDVRKLREDEALNVDVVRATWNEFSHSNKKFHYRIWNVLMYRAWKDAVAHGKFSDVSEGGRESGHDLRIVAGGK
jgi:asparagine synthase (glutamine-hydrolysing)